MGMQQSKSQTLSKTFKGDFDKLLYKLKEGDNFTFSRFSDGELYILKNEELILSEEGTFCGDTDYEVIYPPRDFKEFHPDQDGFYRERLIEAFRHTDHEYYKGITCRCCGGDENFEWQLEFMGEGDHHLSWANLWVNDNYKYFVEDFIPALAKRKVILVCHEDADLSRPHGLNIVKHFPVGRNCLVNNYPLVEEMKEYITTEGIKNHVFLFAAASLSNILCHQLSIHSPKNTYIDIGTTLHAHFGFELQRAYLRGYWLRTLNEFSEKVCIW
jgi:hypothetical protein